MPSLKRLKFYYGNAKLSRQIAHFSLPAGWACPAAKECLAKAAKDGSKLTDGPKAKFRCYAASQEIIFKNLRRARWYNFDALKAAKTKEGMTELLNLNLKFVDASIVRIHCSGDYFSQDYFDAWLEAARLNPDKLFYSYTKMLPFWIARIDSIPANFKLIASKGGIFDYLIEKFQLRYCEVVFTLEEAKAKKLPIDTDDTIAYKTNKNFVLGLHGVQPENSPASKAVSLLKKVGHGAYSRKGSITSIESLLLGQKAA